MGMLGKVAGSFDKPECSGHLRSLLAFGAVDPVFVRLRDARQLVDEASCFGQQGSELVDFLVCFDLGGGDQLNCLCECFEALVNGHSGFSRCLDYLTPYRSWGQSLGFNF
jgi:hypothetical protein